MSQSGPCVVVCCCLCFLGIMKSCMSTHTHTHTQTEERNYTSALRDSFLALDQELQTGKTVIDSYPLSLLLYLAPSCPHSLSFTKFTKYLHPLSTDPKLGFQFEPGGTTAIVVLVKEGNLYCVSESD